MDSLFLDQMPAKVTSQTMLVEVFNEKLAFKALQNRCVRVSDLTKLVKKNELGKFSTLKKKKKQSASGSSITV